MGRMDGDGICMGNEFTATPVGSAMAVESQHEEIRRLKAEASRLQGERDALAKTVDAVRGANEVMGRSASKLVEERNAAHEDCDKLRREVESLRAANDRLQEERDAIQTERDTFRSWSNERGHVIGELQREVETLRTANDRMDRSASRLIEERNAAHEDCVKLQREVDRLRHQAGEARTQPARSAEVEMYRRALRALIELL